MDRDIRPRLQPRMSLLALSLAACATGAHALDDVPQPPCGVVEPLPAYSKHSAAPTVRVWSNLDWTPPACVGWNAGAYRFVVVAAGDMPGRSADDVLARLGAVSKTRGLKYWSVTEQAWRVLIHDAFAVTAADNGTMRGDFSPQEMKAGAPLYFREKDNRSSQPITYRMRVLQSGAARVVVDTTNVDAIRSYGVTFFPAGSLHTSYLLRRQSESRWDLYLLSAATDDASYLVALGRDSYVNRTLAAYRHLADIPPVVPGASMDERPP